MPSEKEYQTILGEYTLEGFSREWYKRAMHNAKGGRNADCSTWKIAEWVGKEFPSLFINGHTPYALMKSMCNDGVAEEREIYKGFTVFRPVLVKSIRINLPRPYSKPHIKQVT